MIVNYQPCHLWCGNAIGKPADSPETILAKFYDGEYGEFCPDCYQEFDFFDNWNQVYSVRMEWPDPTPT